MRPIGDQRGFTLIELLVSMALTMVVMTAVIGILVVFLNDTNYDSQRDQAQNDARYMVDQLSHDLRNATSKKPDATGLIQSAGSYDIVFQSVIGDGTSTSSNTYDQQWVRYCLDSSQNIWRQTASVATSSSEPDTSACPSTSSVWTQTNGAPCCKVATDVTNEVGGDTTRPLFTYGPTGYTSNSQIRQVEVNVITDLNPGHLPGPSPQLTSGIYLRNDVSPPNASMTLTQTPNSNDTQSDVSLNASSSTDPQGQTLTYQWYANSGTTGCASSTAGPSSGALSNGTTEIYDAGTYTTKSQETFSLVVTDTGGLTSCTSNTVTIS
jgi:type II secretory pathway pseudopilin PulG